MTSNTNIRLPKLMPPGKYPYTRFQQLRDGSWNRQVEYPGLESQAFGHKLGTFEEVDNSSGHKQLKVGMAFDYAAQGKTTTTDMNEHDKVGGGTVSQVTGDKHNEFGGDTTRAIAQQVIHVSNGFMYHHSTAGISQSSVGDKVTDHNDGHDHHNVEGDKITFIGGTKYENVNAEFGKFIRGNYDIMVVGNSQHTSPNFTFNDSQQFIVNAGANIVLSSPAIYANTPNFIINSTSSTVLTVGNSQTNTLITPTSVTSPAFYVGDPVEFINTIALTIGSLVVSANGSNGTPNQVLTSNGAGVFWNNPVTNAAGTNTNVQFNNSNVQYGSNGFNFDYTQNNVTIANTLTVNTLNVVSVYANGIVGGAGQVLASGGGVANDYWLSIGAGLTLGGTNTQITFNDSGALNATAGFIFNKTTNTVVIGNATVNASVNSTIYTGISLLANNASYLGGNSAANLISYATNAYNNAITYVGSLSLVNTAQLSGNLANYQTTAALAANVTTMTANDTLYVGTVTAANVVSNAQLSGNLANYYLASNPSGYISSIGGSFVQNTDSRTLSGNLVFSGTNTVFSSNITSTGALITAASANLFVNNFSVGNSSVNSTVNSTIYTGTANNTSFVGTVTAANVVSNAQLISNLANYYLASNPSGYISSIGATYIQNTDSRTLSGNLVFSGTNTTFSSNITSTGALINAASANLFVNNFSVGNSSVNSTVNSTIYTGTANNATNLGGTAATYYQLNSTLAANVATMTANNASNFAGQAQGFYANVTSPSFTTSISVGANVSANTLGFFAGNSTVNAIINSTSYIQGNTTVYVTGNSSTDIFVGVNTNTSINSSVIFVGNATVNSTVNSTIYTGTANNATNLGGTAAASYQLNSTLAANVATMTANNSTNFAGQPQGFYANVTSPQISNNLVIGSNTTPDVGLQLNVNYGIGNNAIATSNNINVNCALGNFFNITCNGSAANIYFTSTPAAIVYSMILVIANGGTNTISWANTPTWPSATAPSASTNTDVWVFFTQNGGTTWRGNQVNKDNR